MLSFYKKVYFIIVTVTRIRKVLLFVYFVDINEVGGGGGRTMLKAAIFRIKQLIKNHICGEKNWYGANRTYRTHCVAPVIEVGCLVSVTSAENFDIFSSLLKRAF